MVLLQTHTHTCNPRVQSLINNTDWSSILPWQPHEVTLTRTHMRAYTVHRSSVTPSLSTVFLDLVTLVVFERISTHTHTQVSSVGVTLKFPFSERWGKGTLIMCLLAVIRNFSSWVFTFTLIFTVVSVTHAGSVPTVTLCSHFNNEGRRQT